MTATVRFGQVLREARELRGFTVEQLAAETHVPIGHIEALEAGRLELVPRGLYRRAEVRAYAEAVALDPSQVLAELRALDTACCRADRLDVRESTVERHLDLGGERSIATELDSAVPEADVTEPAVMPSMVAQQDVAKPDVMAPDETESDATESDVTESDVTGSDAIEIEAREVDAPANAREPDAAPPGVTELIETDPPGGETKQGPPPRLNVSTTTERRIPVQTARLPMQGDYSNKPARIAPARIGRAAAMLVLGCALLLWQQGGELPRASVSPDVVLAEFDPRTVFDEVTRVVEAPASVPTLRHAVFDPRIAANGKRWPRDTRLDEGVLVVRSTPAGARVTVNGVGWGVTPLAIRYLPFGSLRVRVGKTDHLTQERVVHLTPSEPSTLLRVTLPAIARRRPEAPAVALSDVLMITTTPAGARVTVNGIGWGITPVSIRHVPAGIQRVRVVKDEFKSEERDVTIRNGQPTRVAIALKPVS